MAQRLHGCLNDTNLNTIHCDAYANNLRKRDKTSAPSKSGPLPSKCPRDRSISKMRPIANPGSNSSSVKAGTLSRQRPLSPGKTAPNVVHKETISDSAAMVEVTVKTTNPRRKSKTDDICINDKELTWEKRLTAKSSRDNESSFSNFDPLRTLHFLTRELQTKLKSELPSNSNIKQVIMEMQHALNRVPPEIASIVNLSKHFRACLSPREDKKCSSSRSSNCDNIVVIKPVKTDKSCQVYSKTNQTDNDLYHRQMEESAEQMESSCKKMEMLCNRLQNDKNDLEQLLQLETEKVKLLRKEIDELQVQKTEQTNFRVKELEEERDELLAHLNKLTVLVETHTGSASLELKTLIQELRTQKTNAEEECISLRHKLTLANMEKEKYVAILSIRDRQINEIRTEMSQLQDVVNEQLIELQTGLGFTSNPASQSSVLDRCSWQILHKEMGDANRSALLHQSETVQQLFLKNKLTGNMFRESPSGDSSGTSSVLHEMQEIFLKPSFGDTLPTKDLPVLDTNEALNLIAENSTNEEVKVNSTKEMFEELKRQAYSIEVPQLNSPKQTSFLSSDETLKKN